MTVGIVDIGISNIGSLRQAVYSQGFDTILVRRESDLASIDRLILPGVGSFALAMSRLKSANLIDPIHRFSMELKPILGICLGMQLLADIGTEGGGSEGLGLIAGNIKKIASSSLIRIPHVGWNEVNQRRFHPVLKGVRNNVDFYFVHSYCFVVLNNENILGTSSYGDEFTSIVAQKNIIGVQFHPEKSQLNGLRIIDNFCSWDGKC